MLRNYWRVTLRHLKSIYSLINLAGLTVGLAVFMLIYVWVDDELRYDKFHEGHQRIYRIVQDRFQPDHSIRPVSLLPPKLSEYILANNQQVEYACRFTPMRLLLRYNEKAFYKKGLSVDPSFFSMFSFPLVQGDLSQFMGPDKIVITESTARTYFENENPLGKPMKIASRDLSVVGVIKDVPPNSTLKFDYLFSLETLRQLNWVDLDSWNWSSLHLWVKVKPGESKNIFESSIKDVLKHNVQDSKDELRIQALADVHLYSSSINNDEPTWHGDIENVYIFSSVAILVLLIACINYTNLATARSTKRAKETGVRKISGASQTQIMRQFFSESLTYSLFAGLLAVGLVWLLWPSYMDLTGKTVTFQNEIQSIGVVILGAVLVCGLLAGAYPALFLSGLKPTAIFKGALKAGPRAVKFRRALVIIQFSLSLFFVVCTMIIRHQLQFIHDRNMGFTRENIIVFRIPQVLQPRYAEFKNELKKIPVVKSTTIVSESLSTVADLVSKVKWEGKPDQFKLDFHIISVDHDFAKTFDVPIVLGRDYSIDLASDSANYLLNEEAIKQMGIKNPIDKMFEVEGLRPGKIIGVMKDFNFESIHKKIEPIVTFIGRKDIYDVSVRLGSDNQKEAIGAIQSVWKKFVPDRPFEFSFLNDDISRLYNTEQQVGKLSAFFTGFSVFVSCLGLLGIVMFTTEQRTKEVAVRKVLGASVTSIFFNISKEFFVLIFMANLVALPLATYIMGKWLSSFAYADKISVLIYVAAFLLSIVVTLVTIGFFALKAAKANPVIALKAE